jgi:hypothetical protein
MSAHWRQAIANILNRAKKENSEIAMNGIHRDILNCGSGFRGLDLDAHSIYQVVRGTCDDCITLSKFRLVVSTVSPKPRPNTTFLRAISFFVRYCGDLGTGGTPVPPDFLLTPVATCKDVPKIEVDGLLPMILFQRVYISYADRYAVLDPW